MHAECTLSVSLWVRNLLMPSDFVLLIYILLHTWTTMSCLHIKTNNVVSRIDTTNLKTNLHLLRWHKENISHIMLHNNHNNSHIKQQKRILVLHQVSQSAVRCGIKSVRGMWNSLETYTRLWYFGRVECNFSFHMKTVYLLCASDFACPGPSARV